MRSFSISPFTLEPSALARRMQAQEAGAYVAFEGWVRNNNDNKPVYALEYETFDALAVQEGNRIVNEAARRFGLTAARAVHRSGTLQTGDCAVWIGVIAPHRAEAFAGCQYIIDEIKQRLPIWKKEHYADGKSGWINSVPKHQYENQQGFIPKLKAGDFYNRQMLLPEIGTTGQQKLAAAKVLIVGVGGLGSSAALALTAAGIGTLGLIEADCLEASNLHRQILYDAADIGCSKIDLAARRLTALNPLIKIETYRTKLTASNAAELLENYDLILDCTDNFRAKYLLNDASILFGKTLIQASIYRFEGQLLKVGGKSDGCLRCLWPTPPSPGAVGDCGTVGVLGTVPMTFGTLQANEAIKDILGIGTAANDHLITFDLLSLSSHALKRKRRSDCALCGAHPAIHTLVQEVPVLPYELSPDPSDSIVTLGLRYRLLDVREDHECRRRPIVSDYRIPFSHFDPSQLELKRDTKLLVVCEKGHRSSVATELLRKQGWNNVFSLRGGLSDLLPEDDTHDYKNKRTA